MIDENKYAETMTDVVLPALEQCRDEGWYDPSAAERSAGIEPLSGIMDTGGRSGQLHYLCYDSAKFDAIREQGATATFRGAIVISHETIGQQYAAGMPLNLFCHSMGGGIGALVLEQYPTLFDKAVLSAPMIAPATGMPLGVARVLAGALCGLGFGKKRVFGQSDFTPEFSMEGNEGASEARERWYFKLRCENREYQTYCAAFEWVRQALKMNRAVLSPAACAEVETPVLLFQSGRDIWVLNNPQNRFVQLVKDGGGEADMVRYPESLHEIFSMPNAIYKPYLERILSFYDDPMIASATY